MSAKINSVHAPPGHSSLPGQRNLLRGRRRYLADFKAMQEVQREGLESNGLIIDELKDGDEEGNFHCRISRANGRMLASLIFLVSDPSEYPSDHTFFCHCTDDDVPRQVLRIIEAIPEGGAQTIDELLKRLLASLARELNRQTIWARSQQDEEDDPMEEDNFDGFDDEYSDDEFDVAPAAGNMIDIKALQRDFQEAAACGYRPGFIPIGMEENVLSMAIPVIKLARDIPGRALMAWDRRLLARPQHLTLLVYGLRGIYPILQGDGTLESAAKLRGASPQFRVGLTTSYKPEKDDTVRAIRVFGLQNDTEEPSLKESEIEATLDESDDDDTPSSTTSEKAESTDDTTEFIQSGFQSFSLSSSLEALMNHYFLSVVRLRIKYDLGWAGAEVLCWEAERTQKKPEDIVKSLRPIIRAAEEQDAETSSSYHLPPDPLLVREHNGHLNLPLLAFCYLLRRLTLCPRYCIVCHNKLNVDYEALKPYVCDSKLCTYQYYNLNRGPSLEYEICANPDTVDLLVSLAYVAAKEGVLDEPLPIGMGLLVPVPTLHLAAQQPGWCDFDTLERSQMRLSISNLIDRLPPILEMKKHLEKPVSYGKAIPRLKDIDPTIPDAAWSILRWCVASCTAHIEELKTEDERVRNIDPGWRQFRFSVGAPDAEAKFKMSLEQAQHEDANARQYPSLYAFHGSPAKNWHSIIRHGLWFQTIAHGRAYGHGVYFAKEGSVSLSSYSSSSGAWWTNSSIGVSQCAALAEIVNQPLKFVSHNPYFVVAETQWIMCRYLLVKSTMPSATADSEQVVDSETPMVPLDPAHPITLLKRPIQIPDPTYAVTKVIAARNEDYLELDYDEHDMAIFEGRIISQRSPHSVAQDQSHQNESTREDWVHDPAWVSATVEHLLPPPSEATPQATMALQRELKAMLREQEQAKSLKELGWYMPPDFVGDNLFQWIVELHSFEKELPIAQDMQARGVNSLVFEIRFPPSFPHSPPFFRILKPRFLPFIRGGGGHVTGGGSMCMDLLTADGWLPSYSISAILLQIKLAISNLDPRPARLATEWDLPYTMQEALEGYKRAATTHGWKIPRGLEQLVRA